MKTRTATLTSEHPWFPGLCLDVRPEARMTKLNHSRLPSGTFFERKKILWSLSKDAVLELMCIRERRFVVLHIPDATQHETRPWDHHYEGFALYNRRILALHHVAMESTSVSSTAWHILKGRFELLLANPPTCAIYRPQRCLDDFDCRPPGPSSSATSYFLMNRPNCGLISTQTVSTERPRHIQRIQKS